MKKLIVTLVILLAVGAAVVHFFPRQVGSFVAGTPLKKYVATSKPVYQWRDEKGQLQATDEPPPEGIPFEVKKYALDANSAPAYRRNAD